MQSKKARLLKYLQTHRNGITGQDALMKLGLYRLSGEIHQLRKEGHNIKTEMMEREESDGSVTRYAVYFLTNEGKK